MTSGGWVIAGWGFACGFAIASLVWLSYHWWYRIRTHVTVVGAGEQQIEAKRDREAIRTLRKLYAAKCTQPDVSPLDVLVSHGRQVRSRPYPRPPAIVPVPVVTDSTFPVLDVEYVAAPAAGWPDRNVKPVLTDDAEASELRQFIRNIADGDAPKAGRHRADEGQMSADTQNLGDKVAAMLAEAAS
jgi:hypothetical protein